LRIYAALDDLSNQRPPAELEDMRLAPGRGRGQLCWWPLIFKKNFLISILSDLSVLMTT